MKVRKHNYFGFDHESVKQKFEGSPVYCNDLDIDGRTWAVYYVAEPNIEKGHKNFMMLTDAGDRGMYVSGMNKARADNYRKVNAMHCLKCDEVIYSPHRHAMITCECKSVSIDGGSEYSRYLYQPGDIMHKIVTLDALTDTIIPEELT